MDSSTAKANHFTSCNNLMKYYNDNKNRFVPYGKKLLIELIKLNTDMHLYNTPDLIGYHDLYTALYSFKLYEELIGILNELNDTYHIWFDIYYTEIMRSKL